MLILSYWHAIGTKWSINCPMGKVLSRREPLGFQPEATLDSRGVSHGRHVSHLFPTGGVKT